MFDQIGLKNNVNIDVYERGKWRKDLSREFKNIWTYAGREWVTKVMSYAIAGPPTAAEDNRVAFMGFGIGGNAQAYPIGAPLDTDYPGTNLQDDTDPAITYLERPVRITTGVPDPYWLKQLTWADTNWTNSPPIVSVQYFASFALLDFLDAGWGYTMVPLSEIGLFDYGMLSQEQAPLATVYGGTPTRPQPLAYHVFEGIPKTVDLELTVRWEVRVGG